MDCAYIARWLKDCKWADQRLLEVLAALDASGIQCMCAGVSYSSGAKRGTSTLSASLRLDDDAQPVRVRRGEVASEESGVLLFRVYDTEGRNFNTSVHPDEPEQFGPKLRDWINALATGVNLR